LRRLGLSHRLYLSFELLDAFGLPSSLGILRQYLLISGVQFGLQIFDLLLKAHNVTLAARDNVFQLANTPYVGFSLVDQRFVLLVEL
jgi:hypothetical protein